MIRVPLDRISDRDFSERLATARGLKCRASQVGDSAERRHRCGQDRPSLARVKSADATHVITTFRTEES